MSSWKIVKWDTGTQSGASADIAKAWFQSQGVPVKKEWMEGRYRMFKIPSWAPSPGPASKWKPFQEKYGLIRAKQEILVSRPPSYEETHYEYTTPAGEKMSGVSMERTTEVTKTPQKPGVSSVMRTITETVSPPEEAVTFKTPEKEYHVDPMSGRWKEGKMPGPAKYPQSGYAGAVRYEYGKPIKFGKTPLSTEAKQIYGGTPSGKARIPPNVLMTNIIQPKSGEVTQGTSPRLWSTEDYPSYSLEAERYEKEKQRVRKQLYESPMGQPFLKMIEPLKPKEPSEWGKEEIEIIDFSKPRFGDISAQPKKKVKSARFITEVGKGLIYEPLSMASPVTYYEMGASLESVFVLGKQRFGNILEDQGLTTKQKMQAHKEETKKFWFEKAPKAPGIAFKYIEKHPVEATTFAVMITAPFIPKAFKKVKMFSLKEPKFKIFKTVSPQSKIIKWKPSIKFWYENPDMLSKSVVNIPKAMPNIEFIGTKTTTRKLPSGMLETTAKYTFGMDTGKGKTVLTGIQESMGKAIGKQKKPSIAGTGKARIYTQAGGDQIKFVGEARSVTTEKSMFKPIKDIFRFTGEAAKKDDKTFAQITGYKVKYTGQKTLLPKSEFLVPEAQRVNILSATQQYDDIALIGKKQKISAGRQKGLLYIEGEKPVSGLEFKEFKKLSKTSSIYRNVLTDKSDKAFSTIFQKSDLIDTGKLKIIPKDQAKLLLGGDNEFVGLARASIPSKQLKPTKNILKELGDIVRSDNIKKSVIGKQPVPKNLLVDVVEDIGQQLKTSFHPIPKQQIKASQPLGMIPKHIATVSKAAYPAGPFASLGKAYEMKKGQDIWSRQFQAPRVVPSIAEKQKSIISLKSKQEEKQLMASLQIISTKQAGRLIQPMIQIPKQRIRQESILGMGSIFQQKQTQKTKQLQKTKTRQMFVPPIISIPLPTFKPVFRPLNIRPPSTGGGGGGFMLPLARDPFGLRRGKRKMFGMPRQFKYTPSLTAQVLGIKTTKQPKGTRGFFTGLGIRPVVVKRKRKKAGRLR